MEEGARRLLIEGYIWGYGGLVTQAACLRESFLATGSLAVLFRNNRGFDGFSHRYKVSYSTRKCYQSSL